MLEKVKNMRIIMKLFSVVLAVIIWLIIIYSVDPVITQKVNNVSVTFQGERELAERGFVVVNKDQTNKVDVKIRGTRSAVIDSLAVIGAYVNVSDINGAGVWNKAVNYNLGVSGVYVDGRTGETIIVQTEEIVMKSIPVIVKQTGVDKNKNIIVESVAESDTIEIRGAKSELADIKAVVVNVDLTGVSEDNSAEYEYHFIDNTDTERKFSSIIDQPEKILIQNYVYTKKTLDVDFLLSKNRDKYMLDVKSTSKSRVDVGITDENLDADKVSKITYMFNPDSYTSPEQEYIALAEIPEGVYIPEESREITAKFELKELVRKEISLDVEIRNVPSEMTAALKPQTVNLTVRAPEGAAEKIKAYVDVTGLKEGNHELQVKTENDKGVIFEESAHIRVTIKKQKG